MKFGRAIRNEKPTKMVGFLDLLYTRQSSCVIIHP